MKYQITVVQQSEVLRNVDTFECEAVDFDGAFHYAKATIRTRARIFDKMGWPGTETIQSIREVANDERTNS